MKALVLSIALVIGCGGSQSSRAQTVISIDRAISTAEGALISYDHEQAKVIIERATSLDQGKAALFAHRARVDKVQLALDAARIADDAARTVNDDASLKGAETALADALSALTALTGGKP